MTPTPRLCPLEDIGALRFSGPDARAFLQGQLSADVESLTPGAILRAGLHNAQGRTLALLWLAALDAAEILALLPRELAAGVAALLQRYRLRAKLAISDASGQLRLFGLCGSGAAPPAATSCALDQDRALLLLDPAAAAPEYAPMSRAEWRALDIARGLPQVYGATSGQFVAQMLNLDCVGAVSFTKGCYTGQEVIARAHYRGRVKRRLQRFETLQPCALTPGAAGQLGDGRSYRVVESLGRADGCSEFLAVAALPGAEPEGPGPATRAPEAAALPVRALPLPYPLPD
jgi:folate-binding protein YgfZ